MTEGHAGTPEVRYLTQTPEQRAEEINRRGFSVVASVSRNLETLVGGGVMVEATGQIESRAGQRKFVLTDAGIPGGWRQVDWLKGARVTLVQPDAPNIAGHLTVETTGLINGGAEAASARPEKVRIDVDEAYRAHVSGVGEGQWSYAVERPNPNLYGQEFTTASQMLENAENIVGTLLEQAQQPVRN